MRSIKGRRILYISFLCTTSFIILTKLLLYSITTEAKRVHYTVKITEVKLDSKQICHCRQNEYLTMSTNGNDSVQLQLFKERVLMRNYTTADYLTLTCHLNKVLRRGPNQKIISYSIYGTFQETTLELITTLPGYNF